ncbi:MAG: DIP1984 family protein [Clostridiales bacterium]|nr:DIP1984 family protein [Clostridiales bacterium]
MKLAEALMQRSEYQKKIENMQSRILANIKVQDDDKPLEDPGALTKEALDLIAHLGELINKINKKNNIALLPSGKTISEAIVERDMLMRQRNLLAAITGKAQEKDYRLTHSEVKMNVVVSLSETQRQIDELSRKFRELDAQIQGVNWTTDL